MTTTETAASVQELRGAYVTVAEVSRRTGISTERLYAQIYTGKLEFIRFGRQYAIPLAEARRLEKILKLQKRT